MRRQPSTSRERRKQATGLIQLAVLAAAALLLCACNGTGRADEEVPLPQIDGNTQRLPRGVYAVVRQVDVSLDQSTDDAWAIINEQVVPAMTRGAWRGNGLRLGLLGRDRFEAYTQAMPQPVGLSETIINQSPHAVPIIETPRLRGDVLFEIDLTRPPMPRQVEDIAGGKNSTLRLVAHVETEADGRHTLVLTPMHHIPSPYNLIPRDPLEKERDGRIYNELTVRLTLEPDQLAVVGLYWPWPMQEVLPPTEPGDRTTDGDPEKGDSPRFRPDSNDPAAPPPHIVVPRDTERAEDRAAVPRAEGDDEPVAPRFERVAPPLPTHFGSALFTGTRIRQPIRKMLLITIEAPPEADTTRAPGG